VQSLELRQKIGAILEEEERRDVDWRRIVQLIEELDSELAAGGYVDWPEVVLHYLSDADIRASDEAYARRQREPIRRYVQTAEYHDSKAVPWWGCLLLLAFPAGALVWVLL
jgi:hypothetical protein